MTTNKALPTTRSSDPMTGGPARLALLVVLFASFMDLLDATIVTVAAPSITRDLGASPAQAQWCVAAYVLALGSGLIVGGALGDNHGRRRVFLTALLAFGLTSAACALAVTPEMLIGSRVLQGLAAGMMVPQVFGIIRGSFAPKDMAMAFGAYGGVQGLAAVAGPLLGGFVVDADLAGTGWRAIFWINVPIAGLALVLGARALPSDAPHRVDANRAQFDWCGAVLAGTGVTLVLLPLIQGRDWGWPWWGWLIAGAGLVVLDRFRARQVAVAAHGGHPLVQPSLMRVATFVTGLAASTVFFAAIGGFFLTLSFHLQIVTGRSAWETGLVMLPYALGSIVTSGVGVALANRFGRVLLVAGSLTLAISQLILWAVVRTDDPGFWALGLPMFVGGLGVGLAAPILVSVVLSGVPGQFAGSGGGVLSTANQIGGAIGVAALGTLYFAHGLAPVLLVGAASYGVAAALMAALPKTAA
ncbi:MFS transporter [Williamsia sp. CHRR-6]|uniref:MFS transporter n=1 Tax=Williamsia sp. CHRR-6 TaxID=2835871 RepID=UPI001BD97C4D|nr:MFS transporter [Williamsia sp. CHRR-6]MBT0565738.1 MFS transporter [Williamsia sp. CHRR-6]